MISTCLSLSLFLPFFSLNLTIARQQDLLREAAASVHSVPFEEIVELQRAADAASKTERDRARASAARRGLGDIDDLFDPD